MEIISKYFPELTSHQKEQFSSLLPLYRDWNAKINVVSRKDIDHLYERHVLHSLGIARVISFADESRIVDIGTGGGFPGIPLAILFPQVRFHLVDSIGKKIRVVNEVVASLDLKNVSSEQSRGESLQGSYDFIVSRAVTALPEFSRLVRHLVSPKNNNAISNGILYIKGGDFQDELKSVTMRSKVYPLNAFFTEAFFLTKSIIHLF